MSTYDPPVPLGQPYSYPALDDPDAPGDALGEPCLYQAVDCKLLRREEYDDLQAQLETAERERDEARQWAAAWKAAAILHRARAITNKVLENFASGKLFDALEDRGRLQAQVAQLRAALAEVEWHEPSWARTKYCVSCKAAQSEGHERDCTLHAALMGSAP